MRRCFFARHFRNTCSRVSVKTGPRRFLSGDNPLPFRSRDRFRLEDVFAFMSRVG